MAPLAVLAKTYDSRGKAALQALGVIRTTRRGPALDQIVKNGRMPAEQRRGGLASDSRSTTIHPWLIRCWRRWETAI